MEIDCEAYSNLKLQKDILDENDKDNCISIGTQIFQYEDTYLFRTYGSYPLFISNLKYIAYLIKSDYVPFKTLIKNYNTKHIFDTDICKTLYLDFCQCEEIWIEHIQSKYNNPHEQDILYENFKRAFKVGSKNGIVILC